MCGQAPYGGRNDKAPVDAILVVSNPPATTVWSLRCVRVCGLLESCGVANIITRGQIRTSGVRQVWALRQTTDGAGPMSGGAKSRRKGAVGERELARILRDRLGVRVTRTAGLQAGRLAAAPDLAMLGWWIEVKRQKRPNIRAALRQAEAACDDGRTPVAITRADGDQWVVTMSLEDWAAMVRECM